MEKLKVYNSGEWNYDDYTPDWVKERIQKRYGLEIVTHDQINHPLNEKKSNVNVNSIAQYYRHPDYPFWVNGRNIDKAMLTLFEPKDEMSKEDFLEILRDDTRPIYLYFCNQWYHTTSGDCYSDKRKSLIEASKGL